MKSPPTDPGDLVLTKVPTVTFGFWLIKILATTFGETMGDTVSMSWLGETTAKAPQSGINGYLAGSAIFGLALIVLIAVQIKARSFRPFLYWSTIIASTTAGTTLADFATRSLGLGYSGGSLLLLFLVLGSLAAWIRDLGTISVSSVHEPRAEIHYWLTITFSQTLGTALGDWVADGPLGYAGAAMIFGVALAILAMLYLQGRASHVVLFWASFILTRPLGAVVGDLLDKPVSHGGLELSRAGASIVLAGAIIVLILAIPQRAGKARRDQADGAG